VGVGYTLQVEVGGQKVAWPSLSFNYERPVLRQISPKLGPSFGSTPLAIEGTGFGKASENISVTLYPLEGTHRPVQCVKALFTSNVRIECALNYSGTNEAVRWKVVVVAGNQSSNASLPYSIIGFQTASCAASCQAPTGRFNSTTAPFCPHCSELGEAPCYSGTGMCYCAHNFNFSALGGLGACSCPDNVCLHNASFDNTSCSCGCVQSWTPAPPLPMHGHPPDASPQVCSVCPLDPTSCSPHHRLLNSSDNCTCEALHWCADTCGALQIPDDTATSCACRFNKIHLVWILALAACCLVAFCCFLLREEKEDEDEDEEAPGGGLQPAVGSGDQMEALIPDSEEGSDGGPHP